MDAESLIEGMKRDHRRVLAEVSKLEERLRRGGVSRAPSAARLAALVAMLQGEFGTHMAAEDDVLYPALLAVIPAAGGSVAPLFDEHAELRVMLERLEQTMREDSDPERDEQIAVQVGDLAELLRIHIRKEESLVLSVAARLLRPSDLEAVMERLDPGRARTGPGISEKTTKGEAR